jgi:hypothetical protein
MADGGLGEVQPIRGTGEAACFLHGDKGAQQRRIDIHGLASMMEINGWHKINSFPS